MAAPCNPRVPRTPAEITDDALACIAAGASIVHNHTDDVLLTADGVHMVDTCAQLGLAPSISIFDPSFLRVALAFHDMGALPGGAMVKLYFGGDVVPFGLPPTEAGLDAYLGMLDGTGLSWSVAALVESSGRTVATPSEAHDLLGMGNGSQSA